MKLLRLFTLVALLSPYFVWAQMVHYPGEIMIQLKPNGRLEQVVRDLRFVDGAPTGLVEDFEISSIMRYWLLRFDPSAIAEDRMMFLMRSHPAVEEAQWNHFVSLRDSISPNDPNLGSQWQWINNGGGSAVADADVDANQAWHITTGGVTPSGDTIVVCVVDDGISLTHPDLIDNLWINQHEIPANGIDDDGNGYTDDIYGWNTGNNTPNVSGGSHGVSVSGMIGARGDNGTGVTGMNWHVKLMTVKYGGASEAQVLAAYNYPLKMRKMYNETDGQLGAFVVATNSSWGIDAGQPSDAPLWCAFYDTLGLYGILNIAATTNANLDVDVVSDLPTGCPSEFMVGVARTGNADNHAGGYGATTIPLGAPGINIYTTSSNGGYTTTTGTSFASPLVAGIAALMYSAPCEGLAGLAKSDPSAAALLVKQKILEGVDVVPALQGKVITNGRANAHKALLGILQNCSTCLTPANKSVQVIDANSVVVNFEQPADATVIIRYRPVNSIDWIVVENVTSPFIIDDLVVCRQYALQFKTQCDENESSVWSSSIIFTTLGCCQAPTLATPTFFENELTFTWAVDSGFTYVFEYTYNGLMGSDTINSGTYTLFALDACTTVEWRLNYYCPSGAYNEGVWSTYKTPGCGACTELSYCTDMSPDAEAEWIASVSIGNFTHTSGGGNGYSDFTGLPTVPELAQGSTYSVSVTPGFSGSSFTEAVRIWIDFNQNGTFNSNELVFNPGNSNTTVTGQITIPASATLGITRMRVAMKYMGFGASPPQPCQDFQYGEFEDYCVKIVESVVQPPACQVVQKPSVSDITDNSAVVTWLPVDSATAYLLQYRQVGTMMWTNINSATSPFTLTGLSEVTEYEVRVRAICLNGEAPASDTTVFKTMVAPNVTDVPQEVNLSVSPNPVSDLLTISLSRPVAADGQLTLINAVGQVVQHVPVTAGSLKWQLSATGLPAGHYTLTLEADVVRTVNIIKL